MFVVKMGQLLFTYFHLFVYLLACLITYLRWPTTVTSNSNSHIKNKFPTSKSNLPRQTQIRHSKSKIVTAKTNSPHQKQICHSKNKFLTSNTNLPHQNKKTQIKPSAVNERKLSPVFTRSSPDRHFVLAYGTLVLTATFVPIKLRKR